MHRANTAYFQARVTTTSQGDLVILLYDGALKFLAQAKEYLEANDMAKKGIAISKTLDIINELDSTLNMAKGGDIAVNLHSLYSFCSNHLVQANIKKDFGMIDDVVKVLTGLRSAYAQIISLPEAQAAAEEAASVIRANGSMASRPLTAITSTSHTAPAPGANARKRALYAQHANQLENMGGSEPVMTELKGSVDAEPGVPGTSPVTATAPEENQSAAAEQIQTVPVMPGFPASGGFGSMRAKTDMYRKFSGQ